MKKILSLFAAILFAGTLMAEDFHLVQVTSVEKDKTYAFVRNDKALTTVSSSALQTIEVSMGTLSGEETYLWKVFEHGEGFKLQNLSRPQTTSGGVQYDIFLRNASSTTLSLSKDDEQNTWSFIFDSDGKAQIKNVSTGRFLKETGEGTNAYKAYADGDDFLVYELAEGPSTTATIEAEKIDLKSVIAFELPYKKDTSLAVSATNLSAEIVATVKGENIIISGSPIAKEGGSLVVQISAANAGQFSDTIILTSGATSAKVAVEANVVKPEGEGTEEKPFTLADVAKLNSGTGNQKYWVKGIIVGCAGTGGTIKSGEADSTSIVLGNTASQTENLVPVQLSKTSNAQTEVRNALNVYGEQASNIGKEVQVYGKLEVYKGTHGITGTSAFKWLGEAAKLKDVSIKLLKINGAAVAADKNVYAYEVAADENLSQVEVVFELGNAGAKADKESGFKVDVPAASTDPATEVKLTITSEDESVTAEYTIKVSRAAADAPKSNDATLKEVKINNEVVAEKNGVFAYKVAADVNLAQVEVSFICNEAHATADKENPFKVDVPADSEAPATEVIIKITAEDKSTTKEYKISVSRAAAGETPGPDDQAIDELNTAAPAVKVLRNGQIFIIRADKIYTVTGAEIK